MTTIEIKTLLALQDAIEQVFTDDEILEEWNMNWGDNYSSIMAEAALCVLRGQKDIQRYLKSQELLIEPS